ncbi:hypothetical protein D3C73_625870 [compost metagenome]
MAVTINIDGPSYRFGFVIFGSNIFDNNHLISTTCGRIRSSTAGSNLISYCGTIDHPILGLRLINDFVR